MNRPTTIYILSLILVLIAALPFGLAMAFGLNARWCFGALLFAGCHILLVPRLFRGDDGFRTFARWLFATDAFIFSTYSLLWVYLTLQTVGSFPVISIVTGVLTGSLFWMPALFFAWAWFKLGHPTIRDWFAS